MAFLRFHIEPLFLSASPGACKSGKKKKQKKPHTQQVGGVAWHFPGPGPEGEQPSNTTFGGRALQYLGKPAAL